MLVRVDFREIEYSRDRIWKHCHWRVHPVLSKHSKSFNLIDTLAVGVDRW